MSQSPFHELQRLYAEHLHPGRFAAWATTNPFVPSDEFQASVSRYLDGDAHELDIDLAGHLRTIACESETPANRKHPAKRSQVRHFCASVLLMHFYCFDGGGFGHNEMPLVIASAVVGGLPDWGEPSAAFLTALLEGQWEQELGEAAFFIELALACIHPGRPRPETALTPPGLDEAVAWNTDGHVPALAAGLLAELDRASVGVPPMVRQCLEAFCDSRASGSHDE